MNKTVWLILSLFLVSSCKKDLSNDFDHILGKWKWTKSVYYWIDQGNGSDHAQVMDSSASSPDTYSIEFIKKGEVITYSNGKEIEKYRVKKSEGGFDNFSNRWWYDIWFHKKNEVLLEYHVNGGYIVISSFFPKNVGSYGHELIQGNNGVSNYFVRE